MTATLTIQDLFKMILYLLGAGVLVYLIVFIKNLNNLINKVKELLLINQKEIDQTLKELPIISDNLSTITGATKELLDNVGPDVENIISNTNSISDSLSNASSNVTDVVNVVSDSVTTTADTLKNNVANINEYIELIIEIIGIIKDGIKKYKS